MWTTTTRQLSFNGTVSVSFGGAIPPRILKGVRVDVYRFFIDPDGNAQFEQLNQAAERTNETGDFSFTDLPVSVQVQTVIPGSPPYTPVEITKPGSLPNLSFRISVEAEVLTGGTPQGTQFVDIYDERAIIVELLNEGGTAWIDWENSHPERFKVVLSGSPSIPVLILAEDSEEATLLAGITLPPPPIPGQQFHFLRVGRATRDEIGEVGTAKPGYMNSASPSFFPNIVDAPFGRTLQIGGHFGADLLSLSDNLYYTVKFSNYSGNPAAPFDPASANQILDPLFNKRYLLPTVALPKGKWESRNLGPFNGTITQVEDPSETALIGTSISVYQRPPEPDSTTEYWPFWDLIVIWNSAAVPDQLIVLALEAYEKIGENSEGEPELRKLALASPAPTNAYLPLQIDNRRPVPKFLDLETETANFSTSQLTDIPVKLNACGEFVVNSLPGNSNECLVATYSIEDGTGTGNAHPHVKEYSLNVEFTPKGALSPTPVGLRDQSFSIPINPTTSVSSNGISGNYTPTSPPIYSVQNFKSVLVPTLLDGWPPESGDPPSPCQQYGAAVSLECSVRTVNGWSRIFDYPTTRRFIIIKQ